MSIDVGRIEVYRSRRGSLHAIADGAVSTFRFADCSPDVQQRLLTRPTSDYPKWLLVYQTGRNSNKLHAHRVDFYRLSQVSEHLKSFTEQHVARVAEWKGSHSKKDIEFLVHIIQANERFTPFLLRLSRSEFRRHISNLENFYAALNPTIGSQIALEEGVEKAWAEVDEVSDHKHEDSRLISELLLSRTDLQLRQQHRQQLIRSKNESDRREAIRVMQEKQRQAHEEYLLYLENLRQKYVCDPTGIRHCAGMQHACLSCGIITRSGRKFHECQNPLCRNQWYSSDCWNCPES